LPNNWSERPKGWQKRAYAHAARRVNPTHVSLLPARQKGVENNPFLRGTGFVDTGDKRNVLRILEVKSCPCAAFAVAPTGQFPQIKLQIGSLKGSSTDLPFSFQGPIGAGPAHAQLLPWRRLGNFPDQTANWQLGIPDSPSGVP
jgi:hypothetical protein